MDKNEDNHIDEREYLATAQVALTEEEEVQIAESIPNLSSRSWVLQNAIKLMDGQYGGGFYVKYVQDDVKKVGWLQLIIEYPDDTYKTVLLYKNGFKETQAEGDGLFTLTKPVNRDPKVFMSWDGLSVQSADWYILEKYAAPNMPIPGKSLWQLIREKYHKIPITKIYQTASLDEMYLEMAERVVEYSKVIENSFMNGPDRYYVTVDDFGEIAEQNGYSLSELRTAFDLEAVFIKDKGRGYQYSKKIKGIRRRFYALRKGKFEPQGEIIEDESIAYCGDITPAATIVDDCIKSLSEDVRFYKDELIKTGKASQEALTKML